MIFTSLPVLRHMHISSFYALCLPHLPLPRCTSFVHLSSFFFTKFPLITHHTPSLIIPYIPSLLAVPGYWLSVQYLERVGRKDVQLMGFCMMGLLFFVCGVFRDWFLQEGAPFSRKVLFLVLYSLTFLFR
jgi:hypothetical protein